MREIKDKSNNGPMLVYIASDVRSGSTLLDLMLGSHPMIESVGEIQFLTDHFNKTGTGYSWDWKCTCGKSFKCCFYWTEVEELVKQETGKSICLLETWVKRQGQCFFFSLFSSRMIRFFGNKLLALKHRITAASNCWKIVDALKLTTGKNIIVDSSKTAEQFRFLYFWRPSSMRMIYLVRDGRGVVFSKISRVGDSARKASKNWVLENLKIIIMKTILPKNQSIFIKYEDFCSDPQREMMRIYSFLQIPFIESRLSKSDRHNVCGSPHRFDSESTAIKLDERWKTELNTKDKKKFSLIGGWLNFLFGYR